jgi:uncharacterized protein (TIGR03067 family)
VRKLVLALAIAGSIGCKHPSSKLEGHWKGTRAEGVGAGAQDAANAFATQTEITAKGTTITITTPGAKPQAATFVIDSENPSTVVVHTDKDGAEKKETFGFADEGKTMVWRLGEGRSITFQRVKD